MMSHSDPVLQAALETVTEKGLRATTLSEVAKRAGVSRMTIYRRHASLDRVIAELLTAELTEIMRRAIEAADGSSTRARLVSITTGASRQIAAHPLLERIAKDEPEALAELIVTRFGSSQLRALALLETLVMEGQADGSIRPGPPARLALGVLMAAQSFVFSAGPLLSREPDAFAELPALIDGYLR